MTKEKANVVKELLYLLPFSYFTAPNHIITIFFIHKILPTTQSYIKIILPGKISSFIFLINLSVFKLTLKSGKNLFKVVLIITKINNYVHVIIDFVQLV